MSNKVHPRNQKSHYHPVSIEEETTSSSSLASQQQNIDANNNNVGRDGQNDDKGNMLLIVSFWLLGLLNNSSYVIMLACAKDISEGSTALVFLANIIPSMGIKLSAPFWFDHVSYDIRLQIATLFMVGSFVLVATTSSSSSSSSSVSDNNLSLQLFGVALGSAQAGLGEASLLALAGKTDGTKYEASNADTNDSIDSNQNINNIESSRPSPNDNGNKGQCLVAFSSGTGMAGVFGFFWKWFWNDWLGLPLTTTLLLALCLAVSYWIAYTFAKTYQPTIVEETEMDNIETGSSIEFVTSSIETTTSSMTDSDPLAPANRQPYQNSTAPLPPPSSSISDVVPVSAMTGPQRIRLVLSLWPYMVPLFIVYAAEYALQSGTWTAMGFPYDDIQARDRFYEYSNWLYQAGVFISRSSGTLFTAPTWLLWLMPVLQAINLLVFSLVASNYSGYDVSFLYKPGVLYTGAFYSGLLGGAVYINGYMRICLDLPLEYREFALSATSVAESFGIVAADVAGLFIQACLYQINGLSGATLECPIKTKT